jgi:hypothetical protein
MHIGSFWFLVLCPLAIVPAPIAGARACDYKVKLNIIQFSAKLRCSRGRPGSERPSGARPAAGMRWL